MKSAGWAEHLVIRLLIVFCCLTVSNTACLHVFASRTQSRVEDEKILFVHIINLFSPRRADCNSVILSQLVNIYPKIFRRGFGHEACTARKYTEY